MDPECILGLGGHIRARWHIRTQHRPQTCRFQLFSPWDEMSLKTGFPVLTSFLPTRGLPLLQTPVHTAERKFFQHSSLLSLPPLKFLPVDSGAKQQKLKQELPAKYHHCLSKDSEMICRSHANEPMALLTNLLHLSVFDSEIMPRDITLFLSLPLQPWYLETQQLQVTRVGEALDPSHCPLAFF